MADSINLIFDEDGVARIYDDTYDITIHCESQEEHDAVLAKLNRRWIPCSEETPKKTDYYICTCYDGTRYRTSVLKWSIGWVLTGARAYWRVLAWMYMPEPYGGDVE